MNRIKAFRLTKVQIEELAKVCLDIGKAMFLGSVAAFFIPTLVEKEVSIATFIIGLFGSLTFIIYGIILLKERR